MNYTSVFTIALVACAVTAVVPTVAHAQQNCNANALETAAAEQFTLNGDGTATHNPTGLMWTRCLQGLTGAACDQGNAVTVTWQQALAAAQAEDFAGHDDWRLPNAKELASITEYSCEDPALNLAVFPGDFGDEIWSSTPQINNPERARTLRTDDGLLSDEPRTALQSFRLVRDGG